MGTETLTKQQMTKTEATECASRIRKGLDGIRADVLELYERRGWVALGYESWRECVVHEFENSERHLYRLLTAARVEQNVKEIDQLVKTLPESQTRELAVLAPDEQQIVWQVVKDTAPHGSVTAQHIKSLVTVVQDLVISGAIDDGTGEMTDWASLDPNQKLALLRANTTEETYERVQRQNEHIKFHYETHDSQGKVKPAERTRREVENLAYGVSKELAGFNEPDPSAVAKMTQYALSLETPTAEALKAWAGEQMQASIKSTRPKAKAPYKNADEHLRALVREYVPENEIEAFESFWGAL